MTTPPTPSAAAFRCFLVETASKGKVRGAVATRPIAELPAGDVTIRVHYSSLNYKDALAAQGHRGLVPSLPHVPGIDASGIIVGDDRGHFQPGQQVLVTGHELGTGRWGGWAEYVRVPADWVLPLPTGLDLREAMILGTAGFTAAQCVTALAQHGVLPESGPVAVSGASGGVGSLAVAILGKLGYEVTASTGKSQARPLLEQLGASAIVGREELADSSDRPLLTARWAGAVDTVGGQTLATLLRSTKHRGCVAACGLVGGAELALTVHPFILRGVTLAGIDSAMCPAEPRRAIWSKLAGPWKPAPLQRLASTCSLEELSGQIQRILRGEVQGRVVVDLKAPA